MAIGNTPPIYSQWPALSELANKNEPDIRPLLRSHKEAGLDSTHQDEQEVLNIRERLDKDLEKIAALELRAQCGDAEAQRELTQIAPFNSLIGYQDVGPFLKRAEQSSAFVQYLNSYLYFVVRFAAGRLTNPCEQAAHDCKGPYKKALEKCGNPINERPVGLPTPPTPVCKNISPEKIRETIDDFLEPMLDEERKALQFLDNSLEYPEKIKRFELWLRGLHPPAEDDDFNGIVRGLYAWANRRCNFYVGLEYAGLEDEPGRRGRLNRWLKNPWLEGQWQLTNPLAARYGLVDFYWLALLLRAEVSPRAIIRYDGRSWLSYLMGLRIEGLSFKKDDLLRIEEVLRSVFDFACDLIQNAVEMAEYCEDRTAHPDDYPENITSTGMVERKKPQSVDWRSAFDDELKDIAKQRKERIYLTQRVRTDPREVGTATKRVPLLIEDKRTDKYWSIHLETGEGEQHLVGIALSGGGIRSATFCLGVLEAMKEGDRLRYVDYLSTVSGGGYIGAWLLGNVRRTNYWLSRLTSWKESIDHLRRYSKYLAPQSGFLSADSWVIWGTWIRNSFLIQLTAVAWLAAAFVLTLIMGQVFDCVGSTGFRVWLALILIILAATLIYNFFKPTLRPTQHQTAVLLAWAGSFLGAALLWRGAQGPPYNIHHYSTIFTGAFQSWPVQLSAVLAFCFFLLGFASFWPRIKPFCSIAIAALTLFVEYLCLCAILYLFGIWAREPDHYLWFAYVLGPPLVLVAMIVTVIVFIGLIGRPSDDWKREWWTRYGAWLAMFGAGFIALSLAAVFGPLWIEKLITGAKGQHDWANNKLVAAVLSWIGSTIAGLLAGKSGKTKGQGQGSSKALEWVAAIGAVLFVAGAVLVVSSVLRLAMLKIWLDIPSPDWWSNLSDLLTGPLSNYISWPIRTEITFVILLLCAAIFSWRFNLNVFGMNQFYRNRLVRCYLGATRWQPGLRCPQGFTNFDEKDDIRLADLRFDPQPNSDRRFIPQEPFGGPFPIVNCALNLGGSSDLTVKTRQSASFSLTPLHAGSSRTKMGYAPVLVRSGFADDPTLGKAVSISGAAASPNMGYNTTPLVAILLTMFNVRLGWWFPNPGHPTKWHQDSPVFSLSYLIWEFFGLANEKSNFVNVSDGGHFENLGIYELIRRRAAVIIACDGECDPDFTFGSLGNVVRICETDFGAKIEIDVTSIRKQKETGLSLAHCAVGIIKYSNGSIGHLIYLKASITGDEDVGVQQYLAAHPDFPHQTTADQFFTEDQFESYRRLGHHIATLAFRGVAEDTNMVALASKLYDIWAPGGSSSTTFVNHAKALDQMWERFRTSPVLVPLLQELVADHPASALPATLDPDELCACVELLQLMENVFLDLRLDDFWTHPDNRGWVMLFTMWAKSPKFRAVWKQKKHIFGIRFEYFCGQRLGMETDHPVARV
jgi:hypothetical protein